MDEELDEDTLQALALSMQEVGRIASFRQACSLYRKEFQSLNCWHDGF